MTLVLTKLIFICLPGFVSNITSCCSTFFSFQEADYAIWLYKKFHFIISGEREIRKGKGKTVILATSHCSVAKHRCLFYYVHRKSLRRSWVWVSDIDLLEVTNSFLLLLASYLNFFLQVLPIFPYCLLYRSCYIKLSKCILLFCPSLFYSITQKSVQD